MEILLSVGLGGEEHSYIYLSLLLLIKRKEKYLGLTLSKDSQNHQKKMMVKESLKKENGLVLQLLT